ncbi:TIGR03767 family metallophosphoesterase [Jiangella endophytica]|uniref:TIGR03767 family metallophosphoesterase n=1 Tax=Jiangella endophytica TaxID=1623398 RepID=UPI0013007616|nr:TIGR03767 family metallophosphoesterase [Jiangella endophytica]
MRTTRDRVLLAGDAVASGTETAYRALAAAPGEAHAIRADLCAMHPGDVGPGRPILRLAHLTDMHLADTQSPLRLDFAMQVGERSPGWGGAVTYTFRPHELMTAHAVDAMLRTLRGLDLDLCVVTGDSTDNAQANELATYLALMDGGEVAPVSAGGVYRGPQSAEWGDPWYWVPDVPGDRYQRRWGYPRIPGLTAAAAAPFRAAGAGTPWIGCLGNHDVLVGGTTAVSDELDAIAVGGRKAVGLPAGLGDERELELYLRDPVRLFSGPGVDVPADPERRLLRTRDIVRAHLGRGGAPGPAGRGYTADNLRAGTAYYRYDPVPGVRVLVLDTNHRQGMWDGNVDRAQLEWLADELRGLDGPDDPLVVIASHHATPSLGNAYGVCPDDHAAVAFAAELLEVALSCPNVVLWLNGHHHANRVVAHHRPRGGGLYEVTTASMIDWPTQARVIELVRQPDGVLRMTSTIVDHDAPLDPGPDPRSPGELASLHRRLAANDVWRGGARQGLTGTPPDRNVHLLVPPVRPVR